MARSSCHWTYRRLMAIAVRVVKGVLAMVALFFGEAFVLALASSNTGVLEKGTLLVLAALLSWGSVALTRVVAPRRSS